MDRKITEPGRDTAASDIGNRLFFRLFQVGNTLHRQTSKLGITGVQWAVLGALSRPQASEGMSFTDLAEYLVVSRQSLDGVLKRLERAKHVERVANTQDRRARQVVLTAEGRQFWIDLKPGIMEFYRQALIDFRFDDKVSLVHYLNKLQGGLSSIEIPPQSED
jgi:DNA-binding MarR family transcriptional regulator